MQSVDFSSSELKKLTRFAKCRSTRNCVTKISTPHISVYNISFYFRLKYEHRTFMKRIILLWLLKQKVWLTYFLSCCWRYNIFVFTVHHQFNITGTEYDGGLVTHAEEQGFTFQFLCTQMKQSLSLWMCSANWGSISHTINELNLRQKFNQLMISS